jgi:hypothetical protein
MLAGDVIRHFGSKSKTAAALGLTKGALTHWKKYVPAVAVAKVEQATGGKFIADPELYAKLREQTKRKLSRAAKRRHRNARSKRNG